MRFLFGNLRSRRESLLGPGRYFSSPRLAQRVEHTAQCKKYTPSKKAASNSGSQTDSATLELRALFQFLRPVMIVLLVEGEGESDLSEEEVALSRQSGEKDLRWTGMVKV